MSLHTAIPVPAEPAEPAEIETPATSSESNRNDKVDLNVGRAQVPEPQKKPLHRSVSSSGDGKQRLGRSQPFLSPDQESSSLTSTVSSPSQLQPLIFQPLRNEAAPRTDAPSCYKIAGWWIEECLTNHPLCASTRADHGSNK